MELSCYAVADDVHQPAPATAKTDHFISFMQGAQGDAADGRVQAGGRRLSGQNSDYAFFPVVLAMVGRVASSVEL